MNVKIRVDFTFIFIFKKRVEFYKLRENLLLEKVVKINNYSSRMITMDDDPFVLLENGFRKMNALDFLLNEHALEEI